MVKDGERLLTPSFSEYEAGPGTCHMLLVPRDDLARSHLSVPSALFCPTLCKTVRSASAGDGRKQQGLVIASRPSAFAFRSSCDAAHRAWRPRASKRLVLDCYFDSCACVCPATDLSLYQADFWQT